MKRIVTGMARKVCNIFRGTAKANETKCANTENEKTSDKQAVIDQVRMVYEKLKGTPFCCMNLNTRFISWST